MRLKAYWFLRHGVVFVLCSFLLLSTQLMSIPTSLAHTSTRQGGYVLQSPASTCLQPPQNVDLMTLSDAQLHLYGLPTHATLDANPTHWSQVLAHSKTRTCGSYPSSSKLSHEFKGKAIPSSKITPNTAYCPDPGSMCPSTNWSGNEASLASRQRGIYRTAEVVFNVPSIPGAPTDAHVSIWAGVGGDANVTPSTVLVQAGVDVSLTPVGTQYNLSWWEVWPYNAEQNLPLCRLNTGDQVDAYIESNLNNSGNDYFYLDNITANCYNTHTETASKYFSDSASGECIVERPGVFGSNTLYPLANFGTEHLYTCRMRLNGQSSAQPIQLIDHHYDQIYRDTSNPINPLATVGPITNYQDFPVFWHASS